MTNPKEIWEGIEFSKVTQPEILQDLLDNCVLTTPEGVKSALNNAIWRGYVAGREQAIKNFEHD